MAPRASTAIGIKAITARARSTGLRPTEAPVKASEVTLVDHGFLADMLAKQTRGAEQQNENQHREGEDVAVLRTDDSMGERRHPGRCKGLDEAEEQAAEHRARDRADAAQDRGRKSLHADNETHRKGRDAVVGGVEDAGHGPEPRP